jgi:LemA protein
MVVALVAVAVVAVVLVAIGNCLEVVSINQLFFSPESNLVMNDREIRIPEDIAPDVLELASRYYADQSLSYSASELIEAGKEVQIPAELIEQAIQEIQAQRLSQLKQQKQTQQQRQICLKIGTGILVALALWGIWTYNSLSSAASQVEASWAQVENQLQRRADLIPTLISVTQAYAKQEKELVSLLIQSHEAYLQALTSEQKAAASSEVNQAIRSFRNYVTTNPQLQSSQLFINLQYELAGTENRLAVERMRYNQAVQAYNQKIQRFPNSLLAKALGFQNQSFFQATTTEASPIPK